MRGILAYNEPLAKHTSWHIGGPAECYYCPYDFNELSDFLKSLSPIEPITFLGLGSNVLISDEGIPGTVIHTLGMEGSQKNPEILTKENETAIIRVEAGIPCAKLAKFCAKEGLMGGEFFAGIPGTVGGALAMNAGAFGGETWASVHEVEIMTKQGDRIIRTPSDYQISYRKVIGPKEEWFVAAHFQFPLGSVIESSLRIKELLKKRSETQPIGVRSCGSVFQNPPGDFAARLIEASNLKGFQIGGAHISPKHANFIINTGEAKATDIIQIIHHIKATVHDKHNIHLEPEVRLLGFK